MQFLAKNICSLVYGRIQNLPPITGTEWFSGVDILQLAQVQTAQSTESTKTARQLQLCRYKGYRTSHITYTVANKM